MALVRSIHLPPEMFGEDRLIPVSSLLENSVIRLWAESVTPGKEMLSFTIVEVEEKDSLATGAVAAQIAVDTIDAYKKIVSATVDPIQDPMPVVEVKPV